MVDLKFLVKELQIQKPHWKLIFASVPLIPKFASEVPQGFANFGIGTLAFFGSSIRQSSRLVLQPSLGHLLDLNVWRRIEPPNPAARTLNRKLAAEAAVSERNDGRALLAIYGPPVVGGSPSGSGRC